MKKKRETKNNYSTVSIPKPLLDKIKKTIKNTGYVSVSDFVTDVLRTILVSKNLEDLSTPRGGSPQQSEELRSKRGLRDEELIKQRLKSLGYLK